VSSRTIPGAGLAKGMWVLLYTMFRTIFRPKKYLATVNYPKVKEQLVPRARGVIALDQEACTVCMLCARNCPDWCIYIEGHKEELPPEKPGGRIKVRNKLDRFDIDFALCMYCGICVEVCPFDALFWSPEYEYSESRMGDLMHDKEQLSAWLATVPDQPELEK
jgi:NADH-quinone oxidoreductase subunit I